MREVTARSVPALSDWSCYCRSWAGDRLDCKEETGFYGEFLAMAGKRESDVWLGGKENLGKMKIGFWLGKKRNKKEGVKGGL
jgi:hypothetical protein